MTPCFLHRTEYSPLSVLRQILTLLSAHDGARLTRRHRWVLYALMTLGRFPKQQRFHGHPIGRHRRDLANWLENKRELKARTGISDGSKFVKLVRQPARHNRIQFDFEFEGVRYRPTLERAPTEANLHRARLQLQGIKERIAPGTFSFAEEFLEYRFRKH